MPAKAGIHDHSGRWLWTSAFAEGLAYADDDDAWIDRVNMIQVDQDLL